MSWFMNGSCTSDQNDTRSFISRSRRCCSDDEVGGANGMDDDNAVITVDEAVRAASERASPWAPRAETLGGSEVVSIRPDREPTTRRSATFFNSRTLPGQS